MTFKDIIKYLRSLEWNPRDSAPRDGREIHLLIPHRDGITPFCSWNPDVGAWFQREGDERQKWNVGPIAAGWREVRR